MSGFTIPNTKLDRVAKLQPLESKYRVRVNRRISFSNVGVLITDMTIPIYYYYTHSRNLFKFRDIFTQLQLLISWDHRLPLPCFDSSHSSPVPSTSLVSKLLLPQSLHDVFWCSFSSLNSLHAQLSVCYFCFIVLYQQ